MTQSDEHGHDRGLVRRTMDDFAYAIAALPLGIASFTVVLVGLMLGVTLIWMIVGLPVLAGTAWIARGFARAERVRLRVHLGRRAPSPDYLRAPDDAGLLRRSLTPVRDPQSWLDMMWALLAFVTGLVAGILALSWWAVVINGFTYWFWQQWLPDGHDQQGLAELLGLGSSAAAESLFNLALGLLALVLAPLAMRVAALVHAAPADVMLCSRAALQVQVREAAGSRDLARQGEADALRRLERDIHDGPQQRLVRLAMDLGRARHQFDQDPERARASLDVAYAQARDAIDELRALSRGIAPPLLVDRGLVAALEELLGRYDQRLHLELDAEGLRALPAHVETCAYFVVAEAMTNVAKHSGAASVSVGVVRRGDVVSVEVCDDGVGGAHPSKGTGLAGLEQRVRGAGGTLVVDSPAGGPTSVHAEIPVAG